MKGYFLLAALLTGCLFQIEARPSRNRHSRQQNKRNRNNKANYNRQDPESFYSEWQRQQNRNMPTYNANLNQQMSRSNMPSYNAKKINQMTRSNNWQPYEFGSDKNYGEDAGEGYDYLNELDQQQFRDGSNPHLNYGKQDYEIYENFDSTTQANVVILNDTQYAGPANQLYAAEEENLALYTVPPVPKNTPPINEQYPEPFNQPQYAELDGEAYDNLDSITQQQSPDQFDQPQYLNPLSIDQQQSPYQFSQPQLFNPLFSQPTEDSIPQDSACKTIGGNGKGAPCVFPFTFQGTQYNHCITTNYFKEWCATTADFEKDLLFGECGASCPGPLGRRIRFVG